MKRSFWNARQSDSLEAENMEAAVDVEPSRPPRRLRALLALALSGALGGFLISYLLPPKYTAQSTVLVEGQKVPDEYVHPIITADFAQRVQTLSQEVLSPSRLRPVIHSLNLVKPEDEGKLIGDIQQNMQVEPVITTMSAAVAASPTDRAPSASNEPLPGFTVSYSDSDAVRAQKVCDALTSLIVDENLRSRSDVAQSTTDFLRRQVEDARHALEKQGVKLAILKNRSPRSPEEDAEYKVRAPEYDVAQKNYVDLLTKLNSAQLGTDMENQQLSEQMHIVASAGLPEAPEFPIRPLLALWGLGVALLLGIGRVLWPAVRKLFKRLALLLSIDTEIE